jgi:hypothetical protein
MKMNRTSAKRLMLLLVITIATTQSPSAIATDHGPSAFGQGAFTFFNGLENEHWTFSFETMANKNGQARGRAVFDISANLTETQVVVKIDCLNVQFDLGIGNAVMTGTVLQSDDPDFARRAKVIFAAEDSSGFATPRADTITPLFVADAFEGDCHDIGQPLTIFQISPDAVTIEP